MVRIRPFRSLLPNSDIVQRFVCPPYDVMDTEEARSMAGPESFLHVIRSEIDFPQGQDPYAAAVYDRAAANLEAMQRNGTLVRDTEPCLYIYRLTASGRSQTGIAALSHIDDYLEDRIKKHEFTRPEKEEDRLRHIDRTACNSEPVFFAYRSERAPRIEEILGHVTSAQPDYDVTTDDSVRHEIFRLPPGALQDELLALYGGLDAVYIADGHHRSASTVRVGASRRAAQRAAGDAAELPCEWFLSVTFPSSHLAIMPYNRVVRDLHGLSLDAFLNRTSQGFACERRAKKSPEAHRIDMYAKGEWYSLTARLELYAEADAVSRLDVALLQTHVLGPILGVDDPRTSDRIKFVGGIRGEDELVRLVDSGAWAVAFSMCPTPIDALFEVADAGNTMPPKSTWFEPKLRSGFLIHRLDSF